MNIPIFGASYIYGDSMPIIHYTPKLASTQKKCNVIAYHAVHKSVTIGESLTGHIRSEENPDELCTKVVTGHKRTHLVLLILYDIFDEDTYQCVSKFFF